MPVSSLVISKHSWGDGQGGGVGFSLCHVSVLPSWIDACFAFSFLPFFLPSPSSHPSSPSPTSPLSLPSPSPHLPLPLTLSAPAFMSMEQKWWRLFLQHASMIRRLSNRHRRPDPLVCLCHHMQHQTHVLSSHTDISIEYFSKSKYNYHSLLLKIHSLDFFPVPMNVPSSLGFHTDLLQVLRLYCRCQHTLTGDDARNNCLQQLGQKVGFRTNFQRWQSSVSCRLSKTLLNYCRTTRQIFRYRVTDTLRWLQIKQYMASNESGGVTKLTGKWYNFDILWQWKMCNTRKTYVF